MLKPNQKNLISKVIRFLSGVLIAVFIGATFATIKVVFFDCQRDGKCIVRECIEVNEKCEQNNYDPKTGEALRDCCADYRSTAIPIRDRIFDQIRLYGILAGGGLGIFLGILLTQIKNKKKQTEREDPQPLINWLRDAEQIPEEGESVNEFRQKVGGKTPEEEDREREGKNKV